MRKAPDVQRAAAVGQGGTGRDAGHDAGASGAAVLDLHLDDLRQMFNAMDPAPFRERDLDPAAESYIVDWAEEQAPRQPLALVVHLDRADGTPEATPAAIELLGEAVRAYFRARDLATRRTLKRLFRDGRVSLAIGIAFLAVAIVAGEVVAGFVSKESYASILKESFVIGGWVALWRPIEIFFYDWWPLRREARLYGRLGAMGVSVIDSGGTPGARA